MTGDATAGVGNGVACRSDETVTIGGAAEFDTIEGTLLTSGEDMDDVSTKVPDVLIVMAVEEVEMTAEE